MSEKWIAVDWGTTNFRAWLMQGETPISSVNDACGLLQVADQQFETTLLSRITHWLAEYGPLPVLMAGMVGSQQGWVNVPYCKGRVDAPTLAAGAHLLHTEWGSPAWILPGVASVSDVGLPEVMRGEEVQLIGLATSVKASRLRAILPGTHSKHAFLEKGVIQHFSTYMTGELYQLLMAHSLLGRDLPDQQPDPHAFDIGIEHSGLHAPLSHLLFSVRTLRLHGEVALTGIGDYLSGLLTGEELRQCPHEPHWLIASDELLHRYQRAASQLGLTVEPLSDERCFIAGMSQIRMSLPGAN